MKQKIVIKVQMHGDKCRNKALKIAAVADGVSSVAITGKDRDEVVVTGESIDSAKLTYSLRKKVGYAAIISVAEEKSKDENKGKKLDINSTNSCHYQCPQHTALYYGLPYDPNPITCSIM